MTPTAEDRDAFEALSKSEIVNAKTHSKTFAWLALVSRFSDKVKATWPTRAPVAAEGKENS